MKKIKKVLFVLVALFGAWDISRAFILYPREMIGSLFLVALYAFAMWFMAREA